MPKPIVTVNELSKRYLLPTNKQRNDTLRDAVVSAVSSFKNKLLNPQRKKTEKKFEEFWALNDVSFQIDEGDRFAIIGRNGAGKSTLLKILSRIVTPTHGSVCIRGKVASLLEVGTGFHPELSGRENIFLNGAILGMERREIKEKFDEIVAFAEIERFVDTPMKRFSSGMHARLGFAIAAHLDPDLLIVDEVLAVGDAQFQEKCLKKMSSLGQIGRTIIFVSHDINAVLSLCNRGLLLDQGKLLFCGDIEQCASRYIKQWNEKGYSWEGNLGDETVRLYKVEMVLAEEKREFFFQGEKASVSFEYEVFESTPDLYFSLEIRSKDYRLLARAQTSDDAEQFASFAEQGRHKAFFEIDTALFHEGEYFVSLQCTIHNYKALIIDDIVLKLMVYASRKQAHTTTLPGRRAGLFLGHNWRKIPSSEAIVSENNILTTSSQITGAIVHG